jgi:hypothetical protein
MLTGEEPERRMLTGEQTGGQVKACAGCGQEALRQHRKEFGRGLVIAANREGQGRARGAAQVCEVTFQVKLKRGP